MNRLFEGQPSREGLDKLIKELQTLLSERAQVPIIVRTGIREIFAKLVIQSVQTPAMAAWCLKTGTSSMRTRPSPCQRTTPSMAEITSRTWSMWPFESMEV